MRAMPRGLAIVAWINVIVGAVDGWGSLRTVLMLEGIAGIVQGVLQIVAGLRLLDGVTLAHRYLLCASIVRLALAAPWLLAMVVSPASILSLVGLWSIAPPAITLWYLLQPDVRALFPPPTRAERIAVDAFAVLLLIALPIAGNLLAPEPVVERHARTAQTRPAQQRPTWSPEPIPPGTGPVTLVPTYDGNPVGDFTAADVRLTLSPIQEKPFLRDGVVRSTQETTIGTIERPWRVRHGRIRISSVPAGLYRVSLAIDRNRGNGPGAPGDLSAGPRLELRTGHRRVREVVPLQHLIALRQPETGPDPADGVPKVRSIASRTDEYDRLPRIPPHMTFAWDAVPGAANYSVTLACHDRPHPIQAMVRSPSWTTDLPPCPPPHPWRAHVSAVGSDGHLLGNMRGGRAFVVDGTPSSRAARGLRPAALTLRPTFDGRALRHIDDGDVWIALESPFKPLEVSHPPVRVRHGRIKIPAFVPDQFIMAVLIGPDAHERDLIRRLPGDFVGMGDRQARVKTDWQPESRVIEVQRNIELVEPEDPATCGFHLTHVQSPVELRWRPVPEAVEYTLQVQRRSHWRVESNKIVVREPSWRGALGSTAPDDAYSVKIAARSANGIDVALVHRQLVVD